MTWVLVVKEALKCALLLSCIVAVIYTLAIERDIKADVPKRLDAASAAITKQVDAKLNPLVAQYATTGKEFAATAKQANGLIADIRREIPTGKKSLQVEVDALNSKLDVTNQHIGELSDFSGQLKPTIDGLNLMFRKDELPKAIPALVRDYRRVGDEIAETMVTVRDTVKTEAGPTALAIRESAQGTAKSTNNAAALIEHADEFVVLTKDLIYGKKTAWQRIRAFMWGLANLGSHTAAAW